MPERQPAQPALLSIKIAALSTSACPSKEGLLTVAEAERETEGTFCRTEEPQELRDFRIDCDAELAAIAGKLAYERDVNGLYLIPNE